VDNDLRRSGVHHAHIRRAVLNLRL